MGDDMAEMLRRMNAPEAVVKKAMQVRGVTPSDEVAEDCLVDPDNWESWQYFMAVQTEWVYGGLGMDLRRLKLDMPGIEARVRLLRGRRPIPPELQRQLTADLVVIEAVVIDTDCRLALERQQKKRR